MSDEKIYIYHTNDIHSDLTYWPRIASELEEKRTIREQSGDYVLSFDIGDASDRVHPLIEATNGQAMTEILNEGKYDAVTIGNNEGITNTKEQLNRLYDKSDFSVILTNLYDLETGERPDWAEPYKVFETDKGERIGVFGLTTPLYSTYEKLGWDIKNPVKQTQKFFKEHGDEADFWILLSHLGIDDDRYLSKLFPIPLILGAHTHHVLLDGERSAMSTLTGAGQFGYWFGEVVISRDHGGLRVESARLQNLEIDVQPVAFEEKIVKNYVDRGHELLKSKKLGYLEKDLKVSWTEETELADLMLDAVLDFTGAEGAILNAGLFMHDLKKGVVTADDLHKALPHPIRIMHCKIKGKHLKNFAKEIQNIDDKMMNRPVKGFGFRGKVFGKLCYKGFTIENDIILWQGEPIELERDYEIATIDYFSFLPFFDILNTYSMQEVIFPHFLRKVVGEYLSKTFPINN